MRIWLIGAAERGTQALRQLSKNQRIDIIVSDLNERPKAVADGVIAQVDYIERITPLNINHMGRRIQPDLILIDAGALDRNWGHVTGGSALAEAMTNEMVATSDYPCLVLT
jgi:CheY-like chemotaxis protein